MLTRDIERALKEQDTAVLIIDMQPDFLDYMMMSRRQALIDAQCELIRRSAMHDTPIIVIEYRRHPPTISTLRSELQRANRVRTVTKFYDNAFETAGVVHAIKWTRASTLILAGVNASCCVLRTAQAALLRGHHVLSAETLITDATLGRIGHASRKWYVGHGCIPS